MTNSGSPVCKWVHPGGWLADCIMYVCFAHDGWIDRDTLMHPTTRRAM